MIQYDSSIMIKIERISHFAAAIVTDLNRYTCLLRAVQWRVPEMRRMVELTTHRPALGEQSVTRLGCSTLLLSSKAPERMTAECWCWRPRCNRLASSTSCFGSSACLQSLSSVLCTVQSHPKIGWMALMPKVLAIQIN